MCWKKMGRERAMGSWIIIDMLCMYGMICMVWYGTDVSRGVIQGQLLSAAGAAPAIELYAVLNIAK